jgi:predicted kinase
MIIKLTEGRRRQDVEKLRAALECFPERVVRPVMVLVSGLPGTGKSYFSRKLAKKAHLVVLESDRLRKTLFPSPEYSPEESNRLFDAYHALIDDLLGEGLSVVFDATNVTEKHRESVYRIADKNGAKLIVVSIKAPERVIYKRLVEREAGVDSGM